MGYPLLEYKLEHYGKCYHFEPHKLCHHEMSLLQISSTNCAVNYEDSIFTKNRFKINIAPFFNPFGATKIKTVTVDENTSHGQHEHEQYERFLESQIKHRIKRHYIDEPNKKFALLILDTKTIRSKLIPSHFTTYLQVYTQNPYTKGIEKFWVRKNWVRPLIPANTYEAEVFKRLKEKYEF